VDAEGSDEREYGDQDTSRSTDPCQGPRSIQIRNATQFVIGHNIRDDHCVPPSAQPPSSTMMRANGQLTETLLCLHRDL
jgi:hypothetical protein